MGILKKINDISFPDNWIDLENYRDSDAYKVEIYLREVDNLIGDMICLFRVLWKDIEHQIYIYNESWWNFSLETWNVNTDQYDYCLKDKSKETIDYLNLLIESNIDIEYSGTCQCCDWDRFLTIMLRCLVSHKAPYSHIFFNLKFNLFFYFHYTGSIGLYYKEKNRFVTNILNLANQNFDLRS